MIVVFCLECLNDYCVRWAMQGDHDVLVAAACTRRESTGVIGENLVDGDDREVGCVGHVIQFGAQSDRRGWPLHRLKKSTMEVIKSTY